MEWARLSTPIDELGVAVDGAGVCAVQFGGAGGALSAEPSPPLAEAVEALRRYFAGEPVVFELPLSVRGGSDFERAVWRAMSEIPYGEMRTYGEIAEDVGGGVEAARAVGVACNRNPLPVIVPCHRVVGAGGKLVGFGGGLWRKRVLLELEARVRIEHEFA